MSKKESFKVYGSDLKKEYDELEQKRIGLRNKVIKRFHYLLDHSNDPYLNGFDKGATGSYTTDMMLFAIIKVEDNYVTQTTQLDLFNQNKNI